MSFVFYPREKTFCWCCQFYLLLKEICSFRRLIQKMHGAQQPSVSVKSIFQQEGIPEGYLPLVPGPCNLVEQAQQCSTGSAEGYRANGYRRHLCNLCCNNQCFPTPAKVSIVSRVTRRAGFALAVPALHCSYALPLLGSRDRDCLEHCLFKASSRAA